MTTSQSTAIRLLKHITKYSALFLFWNLFIQFMCGFVSATIGTMLKIPYAYDLVATTVLIDIFIILISIPLFYQQAKKEIQYPYWAAIAILLITILQIFFLGPLIVIPGLVIISIAAVYAAKKSKTDAEYPTEQSSVLYFPVGIKKFSLFLILFPVYIYYSLYKNWCYIKQRDNSDISPVFRTLFRIFYLYPFFKDINNTANERQIRGIKYPKLLFSLYVLLGIASTFVVIFSFSNKINAAEYVTFLAFFITVLFLVFGIPQRIINQLNVKNGIAKIRKNNQITFINLIFISIGIFLTSSEISNVVLASRPAVDLAYTLYDYKAYKRAFKLVIKPAVGGDAKAQYLVSIMYFMGHGVAKDEAQGLQWLESSADLGYPDSNFDLGASYNYGKNGVAIDYGKAAKYYQKAVDKGHAFAANNLANLYGKGLGVEKNQQKENELMLFAADKGDGTAMYNVGLKYKNAMNPPNHFQLAAQWFEKSMHHYTDTNACSPNDLGMLYAAGKGVKQNPKKAERLLKSAAFIVINHISPTLKTLKFKTKLKSVDAFVEYQSAQANGIDNADALAKKYSPIEIKSAKDIADVINETCWK